MKKKQKKKKDELLICYVCNKKLKAPPGEKCCNRKMLQKDKASTN